MVNAGFLVAINSMTQNRNTINSLKFNESPLPTWQFTKCCIPGLFLGFGVPQNSKTRLLPKGAGEKEEIRLSESGEF